MVHLRIKVGLLGVLLCIALILSLQEFVGVSLIEYSAQLAVGVTLISIGIGYWTFKPQIEALTSKISKEEKVDKIEKHKQDIVKQLEVFVTYSRIKYDKISLDQDDLDYSKMPIHDKYIHHLQSYEDVWQSYSNAKKSVTEINDKIRNNIRECFQIINEKLGSFHDLPDSDRFMGSQKPYFSSKRFSEGLLSDMERFHDLEIPIPNFEIMPWGNSDYSYITNRSLEVATGESSKLEKLLLMMKTLENDTTLHSLVKEIIELRKSLENDTALKRFNDLRIQLFRDLTLGPKDLKGRCDYCP